MYTPARSLISHLHALTRNEPARAVVTDKFNTFTLEQELNMDETLREFFNDVYEITRQIPGKSTHLRQDRRTGGTTATRPVGRPGNGTIPGRQDAFLPSCREQLPDKTAHRDGPNNGRYSKTKGHLPSQRPRGHEKHCGNPISR